MQLIERFYPVVIEYLENNSFTKNQGVCMNLWTILCSSGGNGYARFLH
jgi:hypothetical protein